MKACGRWERARGSWAVALWAACLLAGASALRADVITWTGSGDGLTFADGQNWSTGSPPGASDCALFNLGSATEHIVALTQPVTNQLLTVANDNVSLILASNLYTLTDPLSLVVGDGAGSVGKLALSDGPLAGVDAIIGYLAEGHLTLRPGAGVTLSGYLHVGEGGDANGSLTVGEATTVTVGGQMLVGNVNGNGTVDVTGADAMLVVTGTSGPANVVGLEVGTNSGGGIVNILNGGLVHTTWATNIGAAPESVGTLNIDGEDSLLVCDHDLVVGRHTMGQLTMSGGARAEVNAVTSPTAGNFFVGYAHIGDALLKEGATLNAAGGLTLGRYAESSGTLLVTDSSAMTHGAQATIGYGGDGLLVITTGGTVESHKGASATGTSALVGRETTGVGEVQVDGGTWSNDGGVNVGWAGHGTLSIMNGGLVESVAGYIARMPLSNGTVTMLGTNSTWNITESLGVGGTLTAAGGVGYIHLDGENTFVRVGTGPAGGELAVWSGGEVDVDLGRMVVGSDSFLGASSLWVAPAGTVTLRGGTIGVYTFQVDGLLRGAGTAGVNVNVRPGGRLSPGTSIGTLAVKGNLNLAGQAEFEINGTAPGQYDVVSGTLSPNEAVTFGGTLVLAFNGSFQIGDAVTIFQFDQYGGNFAEVQYSGLAADQRAVFDPQTGTVRVLAKAPLVVQAALDWDWVYQNAPTRTQGRHKCVLTISVTSDPNGNTTYTANVTRNAASTGEVVIESTANPLVWNIKGGQYGVDPFGAVTLDVSVTGNEHGGTGTTTANLTVRKLGDIDGSGAVGLQDKVQMNKRLNGLATPGYDLRHFDLNGGGTVGLDDKLILNMILNGLPVL